MIKAETYIKKELVDELRYVSRLMKSETNLEKKIYYFSAAYGITSRTFRYVFSRDVLLADLVLNICYQKLSERFNLIRSGDTTVTIDDDVCDKLSEGLDLLADLFEKEEPIQEALEILLTISFSVSGPGNYLKEKGLLKL